MHFQHPYETVVVKHLLELEGIPCFLKDEAMTQVMPFYTFASGGVQLQVRKEEITKAVEALKNGGFIKEAYETLPLAERIDNYAQGLPVVRTLPKRKRIIIAAICLAFMILIALIFI